MSKEENKSRVLRFLQDFVWQGVPREAYKEDGSNFKGVSRVSLVGMHGEKTKFHLRYFEVAPGGYTTFEKHCHEHVVYVLRGKGIYRRESNNEPVAPGDVIYISPDDPHQLRNEENEPFGFLCIVDADRDRPIPLEGGTDSACLGDEALRLIEMAEAEVDKE